MFYSIFDLGCCDCNWKRFDMNVIVKNDNSFTSQSHFNLIVLASPNKCIEMVDAFEKCLRYSLDKRYLSWLNCNEISHVPSSLAAAYFS